MQTKESADREVSTYLRALEREMNEFGSALPENKNRPPHELTVTEVLEEELLWVYFYNSKAFVETGSFSDALGGNAPIIVDRSSGKLYSTGTAHDVSYYIAEFHAGTRRPIEF